MQVLTKAYDVGLFGLIEEFARYFLGRPLNIKLYAKCQYCSISYLRLVFVQIETNEMGRTCGAYGEG